MEADRVSRLVADVTALLPDIDLGAKALGARLLHVGDLSQRYYAAVCDQFGISLAGHSVLTTLRRHAPRQLTLAEINRDALVTSGGITFVVHKLENLGLIARRQHPDDRRAVLLRLTATGRQLANRSIAAMAQADAVISDRISSRDRQVAERMLRRLQETLESVMDDAPVPQTRTAVVTGSGMS